MIGRPYLERGEGFAYRVGLGISIRRNASWVSKQLLDTLSIAIIIFLRFNIGPNIFWRHKPF